MPRKIPGANPLLLECYICLPSIWIASPMGMPPMVSPALIPGEVSSISCYIASVSVTIDIDIAATAAAAVVVRYSLMMI